MKAMERAKEEKISLGEIETEHVGYLGAQDTYYVGNIKGVGRIYQQTFIDTYSSVAMAKVYTSKHPINSADFLNDRVIPFFDEKGVHLQRILTDRGTEYCGNPTTHEYQLFLALNDIEHTRTRAMRPQSNGICERFHKTVGDEFYSIAFRRKIYLTLDEIQKDLDTWMERYNTERTHQGKRCLGRTPMDTFTDNMPLAKRKMVGYMVDEQLTAAI
jgi:transposase InsO family protein